LVLTHLLILSGCVPTDKPAQKPTPSGKQEDLPKVAVGMDKAAVENILGRPDFVTSSDGQTIFFYCGDSTQDASKGRCTPILFEGGKVTAAGEKESQKWRLDTVRFTVEADKRAKTEKKGDAEPLIIAEPIDNITVETLAAEKSYSPKQGDRVYINYYTNFLRYVPLRSNPSDHSRILQTLCIGAELDVLSVQKNWIHVHGTEENVVGWVRKQWVTDDHAVKIDAENRRNARAPEIARLEAMVNPIPRSEWKENLRLYKRLSELDPCNPYYQSKVDFYKDYGRKKSKRKRK